MTSPHRIIIFGCPGAGKSTFAAKLAKQLDLPLMHLDKHFYTHNWIERNHDEFLAIQQDMVNKDRWLIDGNALLSLEMRFARATTVIYCNFPRWLCLWRVIKRYLRKDTSIDDRADDTPEAFRLKFIKYIW